MIGKIFRRSFSKYILAIDEGTTSCRAVLFNSSCKIVGLHQLSHKQITPKPGWVENDPMEIMGNVKKCINEVVQMAEEKYGVKPKDIVSAGVTNQRETTVAWVMIMDIFRVGRQGYRFITQSYGQIQELLRWQIK